MIDGDIQVAGVLEAVEAYGRSARFAARDALNVTVTEAKLLTERRIADAFDRPNPFTLRGITIKRAHTSTLEAMVLVKDQQAEYLAIQETGGERRPAPGRPVNVPVAKNLRLNQFGNVPKAFWDRLRGLKNEKAYVGIGTYDIKKRSRVKKYGGGVFVVGEKKTPRTKHLKPGIYERPMRSVAQVGDKFKGEANGAAPKLLIAFEPDATYQPRFRFRATVQEAHQRRFEEAFRAALARELARQGGGLDPRPT